MLSTLAISNYRPLREVASAAFSLDPQIKWEVIWHGAQLRPGALLVDRDGPFCWHDRLAKCLSIDL